MMSKSGAILGANNCVLGSKKSDIGKRYLGPTTDSNNKSSNSSREKSLPQASCDKPYSSF